MTVSRVLRRSLVAVAPFVILMTIFPPWIVTEGGPGEPAAAPRFVGYRPLGFKPDSVWVSWDGPSASGTTAIATTAHVHWRMLLTQYLAVLGFVVFAVFLGTRKPLADAKAHP